jgi:hypothetical protein
MVKARAIRDEAPLPDDAVLVRLVFEQVVRGSLFAPAPLVVDASDNFELFGYYGLSLWGVAPPQSLDDVLASKASRSRHVALFRAADLRDRGLGIVPSGRAPHFDTTVGAVGGRTFGSVQITASSAEDLVARFRSAAYTVMQNPHFVSDFRS